MSCSFNPSFEISPNTTYAAFDTTVDKCARTYIRPDPGGALIPFILAILLLVFHLPTCVIRAVKWESAQYLALGLAMLGIALTVQAFVSTALKAEEVLVWMPLTLVLDVGAMLQMVILILEKHDERLLPDELRPAQPRAGWRVLWEAVRDAVHRIKAKLAGNPNMNVARNAPEMAQVDQVRLLRPANCQAAALHPDAVRYAFVALISFLFLITLLVLQIWALQAAATGRRQEDLRVNWCSPALQDFAVAVTTGNCEKFSVLDSSSKGIGCISLPGDQQRDWLLGTVIALSVALICQVLDTILMLLTNSKTKWRAVKVQRPWLTMFGGVIMLVVLIVFGVFNAKDLPRGITETVWVYKMKPSWEMGKLCQTEIYPPGLRGVMIGYMDGLFESWGSAYYGIR